MPSPPPPPPPLPSIAPSPDQSLQRIRELCRRRHRVGHHHPVPDVPPRLQPDAADARRDHAASHQRRDGARIAVHHDVGGLDGAVGGLLGQTPEPAELGGELAVVAKVSGDELQAYGHALVSGVSGGQKGVLEIKVRGLNSESKNNKTYALNILL